MKIRLVVKKAIKRLMWGLLFILLLMPVSAKGEEIHVKLLITTDDSKDGYPVMQEYQGNNALNRLFEGSFMKESLKLYQQVLKLSDANKYADIPQDTFYLSFRKGSGCYGKIGFYLMDKDCLIDQTSSPYIELDEYMLEEHPGYLQSITQLFAHEMGHILLKLTSESLRDPKTYSMDMHYSNVITEYTTAFNEGFAEHFEIIARKYEPDSKLKNQIAEDIEIKRKKIESVLPRVKRDFNLPLRFNFYRGMSVLWFSQKEALQRNDLVLNGMCIYKNDYPLFNDAEKTILYRNMGLGQSTLSKRSLEQALSTEAVVARFFVLLEAESKLSLQEYYEKILKVIQQYVKAETSPLIEFTWGYIREYPEEKDKISKIFENATGYPLTDKIAPEIWLIHQGKHKITPVDSFAGIPFPVYTFNLNTCETEDLLKLGITRKEAEKIISFRNEKGYFDRLDELKNIQGIKKTTIQLINKAALKNWSQEEMEKLLSTQIQTLNLDIRKMLKAYLIHLAVQTAGLFVLFFIVYHKIVCQMSKRKTNLKDVFKLMRKFICYLLVALVCAVISMILIVRNNTIHPVLLFGSIILMLSAIRFPLLIKDKMKTKESFVSTFILTLIMMYSLF